MKRMYWYWVFVLLIFFPGEAVVAQSGKDSCPIIPMPRSYQCTEGDFTLLGVIPIYCSIPSYKKQAADLQKLLQTSACKFPLVTTKPTKGKFIEITNKGVAAFPSDEGYAIDITKERLLIQARAEHAVFNAIQTLLQMRKIEKIQTGRILDWPAFGWRGFMVDVGRNYQSLSQLKEQIAVMGRYKLNVFHFHVTEDIAWRLASVKYPQLTAPENMVRNKGQFYSLQEIKELIAFCKERFIQFVPEIDMPGHSTAFTRAMGFDMQSDSGVQVCKEIIKELATNLDISYLHIGGDEVTIRNKSFLPEMVRTIEATGKKAIAWKPGGNVPEGTILQLWNGATLPKAGQPNIDSRHLYLNHFDPFDGVTAVYNHKVCDVDSGDAFNWGATLCNWPDRKVNEERDLIRMNAVYPVMLAFAERTWRGGGIQNYTSSIGHPGEERFTSFFNFEKRLLYHKAAYFDGLPFPYVSQQGYEWTMIGPFDNRGKTETVFSPEAPSFLDTLHTTNYPKLYGATIWLRHFWHPLITSHITDPKDSTTWYAYMKVDMDKEGYQDCWIGFNNISRSPATDSPPVGAWDNRNSAVWVNGQLVPPPVWKRGGQKGGSEIPLEDEGYEYRAPTRIYFKKGGNIILLKCPVASTKGKDWQNPVKWMFTFVIL